MNVDLLTKHFAKETTAQEEKLILDWLAASNTHQKEYQVLEQIWQKTSQFDAKTPDFDVEKAWTKVRAKTQVQTKVLPVWRWAAVASILIGILSLGVYNLVKPSPASEFTTVLAQKAQTITLEDGTVIRMNRGAELTYPIHFAKNQRNITLKGEAFFDVAHDTSRPFVIDAANTQVKVLGTSFNLRATNQLAEVVVKTGKVSFKPKDATQGLLVQAGKKAVFEKGKLQENSISKNDMAWRSGLLVFEETSLSVVVKELSHYYQTDIILKLEDAAEAANCTLDESYQNESLENVLKDLQKLLHIEYQRVPNGIMITSVHCNRHN